MRIRIHLRPEPGSILPLNYQYEISSWIYSRIGKGNPEFGKWIHRQGLALEHERFKLFTFSDLNVSESYIAGDRRMGLSGHCHFDLSFLLPKAQQGFVAGLFQDKDLVIGDRFSRAIFCITEIESLKEPEFREEMVYRLQSPALVKKTWAEGDGTRRRTKYLAPGDEGFEERFLGNLISKYAAFISQPGFEPKDWAPTIWCSPELAQITPDQLGFETLTCPRSQLITIKAHTPSETKLRAFQFIFRLKAPECLQRIGFYAGFGASNAIGFGCARVWYTQRDKDTHFASRSKTAS